MNKILANIKNIVYGLFFVVTFARQSAKIGYVLYIIYLLLRAIILPGSRLQWPRVRTLTTEHPHNPKAFKCNHDYASHRLKLSNPAEHPHNPKAFKCNHDYASHRLKLSNPAVAHLFSSNRPSVARFGSSYGHAGSNNLKRQELSSRSAVMPQQGFV